MVLNCLQEHISFPFFGVQQIWGGIWSFNLKEISRSLNRWVILTVVEQISFNGFKEKWCESYKSK